MTLETATPTSDGAGGVTLAWSAVANLWAEIVPLKADERAVGEGEGDLTLHQDRRSASATTFRRATASYSARGSSRIKSVTDRQEDGRYLTCLCEEEGSLMSAPSRALQEAVFSTLSGDTTLAALLGGANVFDGAPRNQPAPYVHLGELTARDWSTSTEAGTEINVRRRRLVAGGRALGRAGNRRPRRRAAARPGADARWISACEPAASLDRDGARGEAGGAADGGAVQGGGGAGIEETETMGAQKGKDLLLKVDFDQTATFATVAGMRSRRIAFNAEAVDITNADSAGRWRELLEGAGVRRAGISGSGIFKDAASDESVRSLFFDGGIRDWQVIVPDFGTISGPFQVTGLEYAGEHDGEVSYDIALESAGALCGGLGRTTHRRHART